MTQVNTTDYKYKDCVLSKHSDHVIYPQRLSGGSMSGHRLPYRMLTVIAIAQIGFTCNRRFISHGRFLVIVRVALNIVSSASLKDISTGSSCGQLPFKLIDRIKVVITLYGNLN